MPERERNYGADRALLSQVAVEAGAYILERMTRPFQTTRKPGTLTPWGRTEDSPVTDVDLEVDALLKARLTAARPGYGWLSEETADTPERLAKSQVFIVDPIDGTTAFLRKRPEFTVVLAVVQDGEPTSAAVYNPMTGQLYSAQAGGGATLNNVPIQVSVKAELDHARIIGSAEFFGHPAWPKPWPPLVLETRASLAYRMALIASGAFDGFLALTPKHEWDIAAGTLLVHEAGGLATTHDGLALRFNKKDAREKSLACAGPLLHACILDHIKDVQIPRTPSPTDGHSA